MGYQWGNIMQKKLLYQNGYNQDSNVNEYKLEYIDDKTSVIETNGIVKNEVKKAPFEVIKVSTNSNSTADVIPDAEFTAILTRYVEFYGSFEEAQKHLNELAQDEYSIFKTGNDGHGISARLAYGKYTVRETYTPSANINTVEEFYVTIDEDSQLPIRELLENDTPFESYLQIQKIDKETGKLITYSNATFSLYKLNEETNEWKKVECKVGDEYLESWATDNKGIAKTETKLLPGKYKVKEIKAPKGFVLSKEEIFFDVNNKNETLNYDDDWDAWITVVVKNEKQYGKLEVKKVVNLNQNVDTTLLKNIDLTKISFELIAKEDIIDYIDGSVIYKAGTVLGKYNLNNNGNLIIENLNLGTYYLHEITTCEGLVLDNTKHEVIIKSTDDSKKECIASITIENYTTLTEISKTDITGEEEIIGAKRTILDEKEEVIDSWISTSKTHKIEGLIAGKTYTLREEIAPNGYAKATDIKFTVTNSSEFQKITMVDKKVLVKKTDFTTGEELEGAELTITDENGNIIESWVSTKEEHYITGLEEGKTYILTEKTCPYGYEQAESITFTVSKDKENQIVEMKDKLILKDVKIIKIDSKTNEVIKSNFSFGIYEDEECNKILKEVSAEKDSGYILFEGLKYGTYYIKEIKAPDGYTLSERVVKIDINNEGVFADGIQLEEQDEKYEVEYSNEPIPVIQTGNEINYTLLFGSLIVSFIGIAITIFMLKVSKYRFD